MSTYTEVGTAALSKRKHYPRLQLKNQTEKPQTSDLTILQCKARNV